MGRKYDDTPVIDFINSTSSSSEVPADSIIPMKTIFYVENGQRWVPVYCTNTFRKSDGKYVMFSLHGKMNMLKYPDKIIRIYKGSSKLHKLEPFIDKHDRFDLVNAQYNAEVQAEKIAENTNRAEEHLEAEDCSNCIHSDDPSYCGMKSHYHEGCEYKRKFAVDRARYDSNNEEAIRLSVLDRKRKKYM